jgi:hypothetical protein
VIRDLDSGKSLKLPGLVFPHGLVAHQTWHKDHVWQGHADIVAPPDSPGFVLKSAVTEAGAKMIQILSGRAEEKFGRQRAEELRSEIEQLAAELKKLNSAPVEPKDEP